MRALLVLSGLFAFPILFANKSPAQGKPTQSTIETNAVFMTDAPHWLKRTRVEKITDRMQAKLEWTIRKINVTWYDTQEKFAQVNKMDAAVQAISRRDDNSIHIGPLVKTDNFDQVFSHELVHIISYQKYKGAIPRWLEEGLANHLSKRGPVDYTWLAKQTLPEDVTKMSHPFNAGSAITFRTHYAVSQALIEMISKKCDLERLIQLSVEKGMEGYLKTYCEIQDLNQAFRDWVKKKAP